jgi:hypothetical protein
LDGRCRLFCRSTSCQRGQAPTVLSRGGYDHGVMAAATVGSWQLRASHKASALGLYTSILEIDMETWVKERTASAL